MNNISLIGLIVFAAVAASPAIAEDAVDESRAAVQQQRDATVREEMMLTAEEGEAFWPLYRAYRADINVVMNRYTAMITDYMQRYEDADLTNEYAEELIENQLEIKQDLLDVQKRHLKKLRKVLPALKLARFYQLENKMNADIDMQLALSVPLVDPS